MSQPIQRALAVVTETYPPEINGVANTLSYLTAGLTARGHRVTVIRPRQPSDPPGSGGQGACLVPGLPIPGYPGLRFGLPVYWRLRQRWRRLLPDLVYIATEGPLGHAALAAARALAIPAVAGFHTQFHRYAGGYGLGLLTPLIVAGLRRFHNRADLTLVPTAGLRDELASDGFRKVGIFGRGVDLDRFAPAWRDPALRRAWGCGAEGLAVLYVGRIAAEKNLDLARAAFAAIRDERPDARFVLVGDGPELPRLRRRCPEFVYAGARVGAELSAHYASGDLLLFPSLTETFGNVVLEAMASGLPVLAFDYAAAQSAIRSGANGLAVPVGDAAAFIAAGRAAARDAAGRRRMRQAARRTAAEFGWERILDGFEQILFTLATPLRRGVK